MSDWRALVSPAGGDQGAAVATPDNAAPSWQALGTPAPPQPDAGDSLSDMEKTYRTRAHQGWLGKLDSALGGFTDQFNRAATMGLSDKVAALNTGAIHSAAKGVNALYDAVGAAKPFPEAEGGASDFERLINPAAKGDSFSDVYHDDLAKQRGAGQRYSDDHPYASLAAKGLGMVGSIPLTAGAGVPGVATKVGATLGAKVLQGMKSGATLGGIGGFGNANDESLKKDLIETGTGGAVGSALGGGTAAIGEKIVAPVANWVSGKFGADAVENAATKQILNRIAQSAEGGGATAQDMLDLISHNQTKPLMLADVGGDPVQGLGERIANTPGAGRQVAVSALNGRDAGAGQRVADELGQTLGNGNSNFSTEQALMQSRAASANPAYVKAGIPSDPAEYAQAPVVDNPKVAKLLEKSKAVQSAIAQAKDRPAYADLPDNSMVLLDKAYKNIGGAANQAKISGNGELARDLNGERVDLLDAITNGDKNHPYHAALAAYSGPSQSIGALGEGASFMAKSPDQIAADLAKLGPNDQEFYRLGAANALKTQIAKTSQGGNEALKISGNDYVKQQVKALAGSDAAADRLINSAGLENTMFQTKQNVLGSSRTGLRLAEQAAANPGEGVAGEFAQALGGAMTGEPVVSGMGGVKLANRLWKAMQRPSPEVDAATARMLFSPHAATNQQTLARILAMGGQPSLTPSLTRPIVQQGAQLLPGQMNMPFSSRDGQ